MKFMHISDVHLGVKPDAGKAWSEKRAQDIWDSFAEMIEIAAEESPDFLLISGDLFHKQPLKRELKEVCGLFARIPCFLWQETTITYSKILFTGHVSGRKMSVSSRARK